VLSTRKRKEGIGGHGQRATRTLHKKRNDRELGGKGKKKSKGVCNHGKGIMGLGGGRIEKRDCARFVACDRLWGQRCKDQCENVREGRELVKDSVKGDKKIKRGRGGGVKVQTK